MKSSIIDIPRQYHQNDLFGIQVYQDALIKFIQLTDTPITIALQGEWGSGKTSLMNQLRYSLCDVEQALYYPVWINTWQYSLMHTPSQSIIAILEGIIGQIGALSPYHKWDESKKKIGGIFKKMATVSAKVAVGTIGVDSGAVDDLFASGGGESTIVQLKNEIAKLIETALEQNPQKKGFILYIDDLDRINPPVAVEILELLKNIFDLKNCVFVLAIDYDVVIKGLKPKFGELTDKNEREFRSFFDKIIQLPFSMPVASYNVDAFLVEALNEIAFFTPEELTNVALAETLSEITRLSVGSNPRSLKRLTNTLSLISIINESLAKSQHSSQSTQDKMLNFALVCMQIAYPYVYNQLTEEADFKKWDEGVAARLKLRQLTDAERESLDATDEFDNDWEKVLFRMCQKEVYLSTRVFSISGLLNKIAEIVNDDEHLGDIVSSIIELSAVTNLKAFDAPMKLPGKFNRDLSNYKFNGTVYDKKVNLVNDLVLHHLALHPGLTYEQLKEDFRIQRNMDTVFMRFERYEAIMQEKGKVEFFPKNKTMDDTIRLADANIFICSNWPITSQGKPAQFAKLLEAAKKLGYEITVC
ncbi:P-loop NTPase fold protein [Bacteroides caecimuris]|uniref:KAP family P-loop NTPase fold protein n=1 Tax=Bacteroides caecimuris TaxID=1796613 RepID=UPI002573019A|nr:P-loop NTPase fold protein [Bacteroides caecimuris]